MEPYADSLDEDGGETEEEEVSENDMEVILEEDEGNGDDDGTDEPADGAPTLPMSSTTDPPVATTAIEVATTSTTAGDPVNVEEEVNAEPENAEEEVNVEQDTEVENALPPRRMRNDPEHEMAPIVPGSLGQQMRAKASFGMASAPSAQHVQQVMTALMQGQTIPLTYGRWVQWDQTSWVGSVQAYRYGVLNGLQVEMDFAQVGLMLRRPVVPGVTHSLALQGDVMAAPKTGLTRESTGEEEADPGVPFERKKPPPAAWFQRQNMQNWMDRMAAPAKPPPVAKEGGMYNPYVAVPRMGPPGPQQVIPGPPPPGPPPTKAFPMAAQTQAFGSQAAQAAPTMATVQRPRQQQSMVEGQTLAHMLRMTTELRREQPAKASTTSKALTTSKAATRVREESADRVTVRSDSPALSVTSSSTA